MLRHNQDAIKHSLRGNSGSEPEGRHTFAWTECDIISLLLRFAPTLYHHVLSNAYHLFPKRGYERTAFNVTE